MNASSLFWSSIHPSVFHNAAGPLRVTESSPRPGGAVRFCCPVNDSLVLVTDESELVELERPVARLRCAACGEMHLVTQESAHPTVAPSGLLA